MSMMIDAIGSFGAFLFATACVPMAWETFKLGKSVGTPAVTVWTFVGATASFGVYLGAKVGWTQIPTLLVYVEFICWTLALWYHYFPRPDYLPCCDHRDDVQDCTRDSWHDGPCNGYPRVVCRANIEKKMTGYFRVDECIREPGHEGPCNGYPSLDCLVWCETEKKAIPLRDHPKVSAEEIFRQTSD